jgi:hypothetical protein
LSGIDSGQIEPDIRFTHPAIYASDKVYAKQRHIRDNVGGVVRTLKAKLATSPARRRGGYDYQKAVLLRKAHQLVGSQLKTWCGVTGVPCCDDAESAHATGFDLERTSRPEGVPMRQSP